MITAILLTIAYTIIGIIIYDKAVAILQEIEDGESRAQALKAIMLSVMAVVFAYVFNIIMIVM